MQRRRSARHALHRLLEEVKDQSRTTVAKRVVGRRSDGLEEQLRLDGTCPTLGGIEGHRTGQITLRPAQTLSSRGVVGVAVPSFLLGGAVRVQRQEPRRLKRGAVQTVDIFGRQLPPATTWQYLSPLEEPPMPATSSPDLPFPDHPHPDIVIHDAEPVDRGHHRLTVEVGADAKLIDSAPLAYDLFGTPPGPPDQPCRLRDRAEDFYGITAPSARYVAYWQTTAGDELAWLGAWLKSDGSVQSFLGPPLLRGFATPGGAVTPEFQRARCAPILEDASAQVGRGSLIQPEFDRLVVLDFENGVRHVSETFGLDPIAGAAYLDGDLVVVSNVAAKGSHTTEVDIHRLSTDLSIRSTIASGTLGPVGVVEATTEWFGPKTIAIGQSSVYVSVEWSDFSAEAFGWQAGVIPFAGEARQGPEPSNPEARGPEASVGLPHPLGAIRGDQLWAGGLGTDPESDPAWRRWKPQAWGAEGGPSSGEIAVTYDGQTLREANAVNMAETLALQIPEAVHPELGPIGRPDLIFPAF